MTKEGDIVLLKAKVVREKPKSSIKKKVTSKKTSHNKSAKTIHTKTNKIMYNEKIFIENFVNLQKAMTNLSVKFTDLSANISKLLNVFEESAKQLAQKEKGTENHFVEKIDSLLEQNKTIAKGLVLMEDQVKRQSRFPKPTSIDNLQSSSLQSNSIPQSSSTPIKFGNQINNNQNLNQSQSVQPQPNLSEDADRPKPLPPL